MKAIQELYKVYKDGAKTDDPEFAFYNGVGAGVDLMLTITQPILMKYLAKDYPERRDKLAALMIELGEYIVMRAGITLSGGNLQ